MARTLKQHKGRSATEPRRRSSQAVPMVEHTCAACPKCGTVQSEANRLAYGCHQCERYPLGRQSDSSYQRREAAEQQAEWQRAGHCPTCGGPDDEPDGCRCWGARLARMTFCSEGG